MDVTEVEVTVTDEMGWMRFVDGDGYQTQGDGDDERGWE